MTHGRPRTARALAALCIAALATPVLTAAPATAAPRIIDVRDRVETLYHQAEQASERYNDARIALTQARHRLHDLRTDLKRERRMVASARDSVASSVVQQYQAGAFSTATQVAMADDSTSFITMLTTVDQFNLQQAGIVDDLSAQVARLRLREGIVSGQVGSIAATRMTLAKEKGVIDSRAAEAKSLLGRMVEDRRQVRLSRSADRTSAAPTPTPSAAGAPVSGRAAAAVAYAMAQVGDAYVYGAAGPDAFDCSGLTMQAWAAAGVSLPHSSGAQMGSGTPVSIGALQPGDLVFYYSPVSHVALYIGNGMIVHASNPSAPVGTAPVGSMPIAGAVRPG